MAEIKEKQCTKCGNVFPLTEEFFYKDKTKKSGFRGKCKLCCSAYGRDYYRQTPDFREERAAKKLARDAKQNAERASGMKTCCDCKRTLEVSEFGKSRNDRQCLSSYCKDCHRKRIAEYRAKNPERAREINNRAVKKWQEKNPEGWRDITRTSSHRRYARKVNLLADFTTEDWRYALEYFHHCCAVCGSQMNNLFGEIAPAADHWIPLSKGGSTIPENMIPLCHGKGGCNNLKHDIMPQEWLEKRYGKRKAKQILTRIELYFTTVRSTKAA